MVEIDSDAGQSNGRVDMSSHDLSMARRDNSPPTPLWLFEVFLHVDDRYGRIAAGSPRSGIGILGLRLLEHYINLIPTMRHGVAVPMFDHSAGNPRYLGWRQKVATWPLSKQEAMSNRVFVVQLEAPIEGCSEPLEVPRPPDDSSPGASKKSGCALGEKGRKGPSCMLATGRSRSRHPFAAACIEPGAAGMANLCGRHQLIT